MSPREVRPKYEIRQIWVSDDGGQVVRLLVVRKVSGCLDAVIAASGDPDSTAKQEEPSYSARRQAKAVPLLPAKPYDAAMKHTRRHNGSGDDEEEEESQDTDALLFNASENGENKEEKLKVVVRVRPLQKNEEPWGTTAKRTNGPTSPDLDEGDASVATASSLCIQDNHMMWEKNGHMKILMADAVFPGSAPQGKVFESVQAMSGLERSVEDVDQAFAIRDTYGIVPRSVEKLFAQMEQEKTASRGGVSFEIYCSFIEIYNEKIYDIFSANTSTPVKRGSVTHRAGWNCVKVAKEVPSLSIRQKLDDSVFVDGLTSRNLSSRDEMLKAFREGSMNREVRDNLYNQHSSRGHSIFQITLRKNFSTSEAEASLKKSSGSKDSSSKSAAMPRSRLSRLFFVDLAGSEKWHVNGSDLSDKYASELSSINKSLSALTNCVLALTQRERTHTPFRDSILTRLLQSCLQGIGRTAFIITVSPAKESLEESFATLRFAERLKTLRCRPIRKKVFSNDLVGEQRVYYEQQIQTMRVEVNRLRELLKKAHRKNSDIVDSTTAAANSALVEENRHLKELLMHSQRTRLIERGERMAGKGGMISFGNGSLAQQPTAKQIVKLAQSAQNEDSRSAFQSSSISNSPGIQKQSGVAPGGTTGSQPVSNASRLRRPNNGGMRGSSHLGTKEKEKNTATALDEDGEDEDFGGSMQQMDSLLNSLHSKEARLNWMLEAEMEAQNMQTGTRKARESSSTGHSDPIAGKATVMRTWAVEKRLRNLVQVPQPIRRINERLGALPTLEAQATISSAPSTVGNPNGTTKQEEPSYSARHQAEAVLPLPVKSLSSLGKQDDALSSLAFGNSKHDSPRQPTRVNELTKTSTAAGHALTARTVASGTTQHSGRTDLPQPTSKGSGLLLKMKHQLSNEPKSSSILNLIGGSGKMGKSKEELVDEYKRARRAELEAMLRNMMQK